LFCLTFCDTVKKWKKIGESAGTDLFVSCLPVEDDVDGGGENRQDHHGSNPHAQVESDEKDVFHVGGRRLSHHESDGVGVALLDQVHSFVSVFGEENRTG
jgi:hypothetical protein